MPSIGGGQSQLLAQSKKRILANGQSQASLQNTPQSNGIQINGQGGSSYKRIVNIYSVNNYKNKRKSQAPESRLHLNHSMLPSHGVQGQIGPYDEQRRIPSIDNIQLPEIGTSKHSSQPYENPHQGRGVYNYKSTIDQ